MKVTLTLLSLIPFVLATSIPSSIETHGFSKREPLVGIDISNGTNIDWGILKANRIAFAYIKATEGTGYTNPSFSSQYTGATNVRLIRGSTHVARPDVSSGATQATYFLTHGGGWTADGITLPGALDIFYNPYGATCFGLSASSMVSWIRNFSNTYHTETRRYPVIYTTADWWNKCTGNSTAFGSTNPLWIANNASSVAALPAGWSSNSFSEISRAVSPEGDGNYGVDVWNGNMTELKRFARNS